jgi:SEC-C motif
MRVKIGRNELCPCGSGKKFKRCCLSTVSNQDQAPPTSGRFRFEVGSYRAPGGFLPSIACLEQWQPNKWRYHFVLVRLDLLSEVEAEANLRATEDLNYAFGQDGSPAGLKMAASLRALGYVRVDGFNIVKQDDQGAVDDLQALAANSG